MKEFKQYIIDEVNRGNEFVRVAVAAICFALLITTVFFSFLILKSLIERIKTKNREKKFLNERALKNCDHNFKFLSGDLSLLEDLEEPFCCKCGKSFHETMKQENY